jgi:alkaline phosphatase D
MRRLLVVGCVLALIGAACSLPSTTPGTAGFPNGVAAGDITDSTAILWTRTSGAASVELNVYDNVRGPGLPLLVAGPTPVFSAPGRTTRGRDFTVKITATGLLPYHIYFYRFTNGAETSQEGRFVTAPSPGQAANFRFVVAADSDGFPVGGPPGFNNFEVLNAARSEEPAFFSFLGDTIYSDSSFGPGSVNTLKEYRDAHEQNRSFAHLRNLMSATGTYAQPDDHEVINDYDGETVNTKYPGQYANGWGAFHDWMPTDTDNVLVDPTCAGNPRYFHQKWGTEAEIFQLDERSCRSDQDPVKTACSVGPTLDLAPTAPSALRGAAGLTPSPPAGCLAEINNPARTMLGPVQKQAFEADLLASDAKWKIVLSEDAIQQFYALPYDRFEGYGAERTELLNHIRDNFIGNVVFLTTDLHANIYNEVFIDRFTDPDPIAYEAISGPIATNTYMQEIINAVGVDLVDDLQLVLNVQGVDCQSIDVYSYQVVDVSATTGKLTITSKDKNGNIVGNDTDPSIKCKKELGP